MEAPAPIRITKFERSPEHGEFEARVTPSGGRTYNVDRRHGSWQATIRDGGRRVRREVLPHVAALLQVKARRFEKRERRQAVVA